MAASSHYLSLAAARALALHAQRLTAPLGAEPPPTPADILALVEQLGCVQIDTLQMVKRSQYLVLWSRLGRYKTADLDALAYDPAQRQLFEYWQHAASLIPLKNFRYSLPKKRDFADGHGWWPEWIAKPEHRQLVAGVRERITAEGGLRANEFKYDGPPRGAWWDWKPTKHALEHLYNVGELMIADRVRFQRVYDLRERVLPEWVDTTPPTEAETFRFRVEQAARAAGIASPAHLAGYAYLKRGDAAPHIRDLAQEGALVEVDVELPGSAWETLLIHRDTLPLVEQAADGALTAERTTFLSPFDSLFWTNGRDELFWGFRQVLEAYKPAPKRIWGYFCLPILHRDRLIGRFDPKLERKTQTLRLRTLHLEPDVAPDEAMIADVARAMRDFLKFHNAHDLVIEQSNPPAFGEALLAAL